MHMSEVVIRPIEAGEDQAALGVMLEVALEIWGLDINGLRQYDPLSDYDDLQKFYPSGGGAFLVAVQAGQLIGTGGLQFVDSDTCELKRVWLRKPYRGQGIGRRLVKALLDIARQRGFQRVRLNVATPPRQQAALGLYTSLGFAPAADDASSGLLGLIMEMHL